ncbi:cellulase family glycosylhydrolase [Ideonella sp. DXS29W]|uniref:Cellulase family glycosylhydrolase n=1 Tax=Ideonella lacteola TaxID=2984193 RepID=A0ABU9BX54_9BURK
MPRLSLRGPNILDPSGQPIMLRGWSWGHWEQILPQDASENVAQGANVVRIPLRWWGKYRTARIDSRDDTATATAGISAANLKFLDDAIRSASNAKLWIVLFIDSDCGQNGTQPDEIRYCDPEGQFGAKGHNFWTDPVARKKYVAVWRFIAQRYKDTPYLAMFEPLPEINPPGVPAPEIKALYAELMSNIREVAPGIPFLIGGRHYQTGNMEEVFDPAWKDVIYTGNLFLHAKARGADDESLDNFRKRARQLVDFRERHQVPVFVQQIGVKSKDDPSKRGVKEMMKVMVDNKLGFAWWTYRGSGNPNEFSVVYPERGQWVFKRDWLDEISWAFKQR